MRLHFLLPHALGHAVGALDSHPDPLASALLPLRAPTDHNLDVLDRAGVLGAVLALIAREATSVRKKRPLSKASTDCLQVEKLCVCVHRLALYAFLARACITIKMGVAPDMLLGRIGGNHPPVCTSR